MSGHEKARGRHRRPRPAFPERRFLVSMALGAVLAAGLTDSPNEATAQPPPAAAVVSMPSSPVTPAARPVARVEPPRRTLIVTGRQGLKPNAVKLLKWMDDNYPQLREVGGVRPCDRYAEHCSGVALDAMTHGDMRLGDRLAQDALKLPYVRYVIWKQQMLYPDGRRMWMSDRGSPNENHFTHVHVRVMS